MAPVVDAGLDQFTALSCPTGNPPCTAAVAMAGQASNYTLNPGQVLTYAWSLNTGPGTVQFASATTASTQASFAAAGNYTPQLAVNDGVSTSYGITHVFVGVPSTSLGSLYISPSASGPNALNTSTTLQVKLELYFNGFFTQAGQQVQIAVTGANPQTATLATDVNGIVTFTYVGNNSGTDTVTATSNGTQYVSNPVAVTWIAAAPKFTSDAVTGRFFTADGSGVFNTPATQQPVFTQVFPNVNFNASPLTNLVRPFTGVTTDAAGVYTGVIPAQGNNYQAGVGGFYHFSAVFTGVLNVPAAGPLTFTFSSDDAFVFGVGGGAARVSGPQFNTPAFSVFQQLAVMGGNNQRTPPVANVITVNFPAAGVYPYERECYQYVEHRCSHSNCDCRSRSSLRWVRCSRYRLSPLGIGERLAQAHTEWWNS